MEGKMILIILLYAIFIGQISGEEVLTLTTRPTIQTADLYDDIVIDCIPNRLVGVKWSRVDDTLPVRARQEGYRLYISNISLSDYGSYTCSHFNYTSKILSKADAFVLPPETPGFENTTLRPLQTHSFTTDSFIRSTTTPGVTVTALTPFYEKVIPDQPSVFHCADGNKIEKSLVCNKRNDCADGSDESNCEKFGPKITLLPKKNIDIFCGDQEKSKSGVLELECQFMGHPEPLVKWKKYEGHVPSKCRQISKGGHGILICPEFQQADQGAYSCVAENTAGSAESQPKSMAKCSNTINCIGFKVTNEDHIEHCLECYCSGRTNRCQNIKSSPTVNEIPFPTTKVEVFANNNSDIVFIPSDSEVTPDAKVRSSSKEITYCALYKNDFKETTLLKSFGRNINVPKYQGKADFLPLAPNLIIRGNNMHLIYTFNTISHSAKTLDVRFWPGNWHHLNRTVATRSDIMKVLSNIDALLIRCEYKEGQTENWGANTKVFLESSTITNFTKSVSYVEKCNCPEGYGGLSCEDCATGYSKKVNGDEFMCEKKECEMGKTGINCEECDAAKGYFKSGDKCVTTTCNPDGSDSPYPDKNGKCICKEGVSGDSCDTCKSGYFHLHKPKGCLDCWCSGLQNVSCSSSRLFRSVISRTSIGGYNASTGRNFWLLPSDFSGNRLTSYGGFLRYTVTYLQNIPKEQKFLTVEFLSTEGVTLSYAHPNVDKSINKTEKSFSVQIKEGLWTKSDKSHVTRGELLTVLSKIKAIYIESPYHLSSGLASLKSAHLSTASSIKEDDDSELASEVEQCNCPVGYSGLSCESCAEGYHKSRRGNVTYCVKCTCDHCDTERGCLDCSPGYYRENPLSEMSAVCKPCPCNGNEVNCIKDDYDQIFCNCKLGFVGMYCEQKLPPVSSESHLNVRIAPSRVSGKKMGTKIIFNCSYDSNEEMKVAFSKVDSKGSHVSVPSIYSSSAETQYGRANSFEVVIDSSLQQVECFVYNKKDKKVGHVIGLIENTVTKVQPVKIKNCYAEYIYAKVGDSKDLICEASGSPEPMISWYRTIEGAPAEKVDTTDGVHSIEDVGLKDNKTIYTCIAENPDGDKAICTSILIVTKKCDTVNIIPKPLKVEEGQNINLLCKATGKWPVFWSRQSSELPTARTFENKGHLTIVNSTLEDGDTYVCKAKTENEIINDTVVVTVELKKIYPSVYISKNDAHINVGEDFEVNCSATGNPTPTITWLKINEKMATNVVAINETLKIKSATPENSGIYGCEARSILGNEISRIRIEVENKQVKPEVLIVPAKDISVIEGHNVSVHCEVKQGIPQPAVQWWKKEKNQYEKYSSNATLRFQNISRSDDGVYKCAATNNIGTGEALKKIEVLTLPVISLSENEIVSYEGDNVTVTCTATGNPTPTITWYKDMNNEKESLRLIDVVNETNKSNALTITIQATSTQLICVAKNTVGSVDKAISITVAHPKDRDPTSVVEFVPLGSHIELLCVSEFGEVIWKKENGRMYGDECPISTGLSIPSVQIQHNGTYICMAKFGSEKIVKRTFTLIVVGFVPKFSQSSKSYLTVPAPFHSSKELRVEVSFKTDDANGILLLKEHYPVFGIFLKNKRVNLLLLSKKDLVHHVESNFNLTLNHWYSLAATVSNEIIDFTLYNENSAIMERRTEKLKNFNIDFGLAHREIFFVGGATHQKLRNMRRNIRFRHASFPSNVSSLEGCISRLVINLHEFDITKEGIHSVNVNLCKRCHGKSNPCRGKGECFDAPTQYGFLCVCPNHHKDTKCVPSCTGRGCETQLDLCKLINPCKRQDLHKCTHEISSLKCRCAVGYSGTTCGQVENHSFCAKGNGYVSLPSNLLQRPSLSVPEVINIGFTLGKPDGLLLWRGNKDNYLSIAVREGLPEYVYFNQGVRLHILGDSKLPLEQKLRLTVKRVNESAFLEVDSHVYKGHAHFTTNRVRGDIYLGNLPKGVYIPGKQHVGLNGCINYISFGENPKINLHYMALEKINVFKAENQEADYNETYYSLSNESDADLDNEMYNNLSSEE